MTQDTLEEYTKDIKNYKKLIKSSLFLIKTLEGEMLTKSHLRSDIQNQIKKFFEKAAFNGLRS